MASQQARAQETIPVEVAHAGADDKTPEPSQIDLEKHKPPRIDNDNDADVDNTSLAAGQVAAAKTTDELAEQGRELDAAEVFLRAHRFTDAHLAALLADRPRRARLVRKVDRVVLPLLAGTYVLQYVDKQAMSYAAVFDLLGQEAGGGTGTGTPATITLGQYGWFTSIFYLAYLAAEYPWVWAVQRTGGMAKVVGGCVVLWGAVLMATAACRDFAGLAACRFFLGVFEAPITTCFMLIVAMWYAPPFFFPPLSV